MARTVIKPTAQDISSVQTKISNAIQLQQIASATQAQADKDTATAAAQAASDAIAKQHLIYGCIGGFFLLLLIIGIIYAALKKSKKEKSESK